MCNPHRWEVFADVVTPVCAIIGVVIAAYTANFAKKTVAAMRDDRDSEVLIRISEVMQCDAARAARALLWNELAIPGVTLEEWCLNNTHFRDSTMEKAIGDVCWRLDLVGLLAESATSAMKDRIQNKWGPIAKVWWPKLKVFVEARRTLDDRPTLWDHFEKFANAAGE